MTTVQPTITVPAHVPFPQTLERRDTARLRAYAENLDFYNGLQWSGRPRRQERRLVFNYVKTLVDKVAAYVCADVRADVTPLDASPGARDGARAAEDALRRIAEDNDLDLLDLDSEVDAAILGDGCYKVTWDSEGRRVRITTPDVQGIYAWWTGDDISRVWRVASRYRLAQEEAEDAFGMDLAAHGAGDRPVTVVEVWTARDFQLWVDSALVQEMPNPYGFLPFIIYPNLRLPKQFWGVSDVGPLIEPARELNRTLSQLSTILELSGNPIAVLENVDGAQDIAVQPGAVWELPERARAYLLDLLQGGGVRLHADYTEVVYRALHDISEVPRTAFGQNSQALSGVALEMEMQPLLQKVKRKRLIRGAVYRKRNEMALRILEQKTGVSYAPYRTHVLWGPVLPQDRSRDIQDEELLVRSGVHSRRTAMLRLGVQDPDTELARIAEEQTAGG